MLQNTIKDYLKDDRLKLKLIKSIINCLDRVNKIDIQQKWVEEILKENL